MKKKTKTQQPMGNRQALKHIKRNMDIPLKRMIKALQRTAALTAANYLERSAKLIEADDTGKYINKVYPTAREL